MLRKKKKILIKLFTRMLVVIGIFAYVIILAGNPTKTKNAITNVDGVKSIEAMRIISKYDSRTQKLEVVHVNDMNEAAAFGPNTPISFTGQMTAYKATCVGCTGRVSCPPSQDVRNGNILFNDQVYGQVRILAADPSIPCGTIVKITNVTFSNEPIIGIVLDRGGAIKGNIMDFLMNETDNMDVVGRQYNVNYEVMRWGW